MMKKQYFYKPKYLEKLNKKLKEKYISKNKSFLRKIISIFK